jgi:hypothetical protein
MLNSAQRLVSAGRNPRTPAGRTINQTEQSSADSDRAFSQIENSE